MSKLQTLLAIIGGLLGLLAGGLALVGGAAPWPILVFLALAALSLLRFVRPVPVWGDCALAVFGVVAILMGTPDGGAPVW
ncbi:MAG TPA: hypothetical protein VL133_04450, partial [Devosia sp.]|nr:hypothetical protein [Devosia sp.]